MLDGLKIFSSLSEQELQEVSLFCQKKTLATGDTLFTYGDEANSLYIVKNGSLEVLDQNQKKLGVVSEDDVLGEMAILGGEKLRTATAKALENTTLITILGFSMEKLSETNSEIFEKIQEIITERRQDNIDI